MKMTISFSSLKNVVSLDDGASLLDILSSHGFCVEELVLLGDDLFCWADAVYGYISEAAKDFSKLMIQKTNCLVYD